MTAAAAAEQSAARGTKDYATAPFYAGVGLYVRCLRGTDGRVRRTDEVCTITSRLTAGLVNDTGHGVLIHRSLEQQSTCGTTAVGPPTAAQSGHST